MNNDESDTFTVSSVLGISTEVFERLQAEFHAIQLEEVYVVDLLRRFADGRNNEDIMCGLLIAWYLEKNERSSPDGRDSHVQQASLN